jgi:predicted DNA-binding protein with PD1-like motif
LRFDLAMPLARHLKQPGPVAESRLQAFAAQCTPLDLVLEPGLSLFEALRRPLAERACDSAVVELEGGALGPLSYFLPAYASDTEHAAFYSEQFRQTEACALQLARGTFGQRDGAPFLHCHAIWTGAAHAGEPRGGHVLPPDTQVAAPIRARVWLLDGAGFVAQADAETHFTLFAPQALAPRAIPAGAAARPCFAVRMAPNQDICTALEQFCAREQIERAEVRGGVASIVGACFDDGRTVASDVTEMLIRTGRLERDASGAMCASLDIALVDHTGTVAAGRLARGANAILITAELVLEVT